MIQEIIVGILFIGAVVYLIFVFRKQAKAKSGCASGDCKCSPKVNARTTSRKPKLPKGLVEN